MSAHEGAVERWLAWRYLATRQREGFVSFIAVFSLIGIALGVATLIVVLSVMGEGNYPLGARAKQIRDDLFAKEKLSAADLMDIQLDNRAVFLDRWQALALRVLDDGAKTCEVFGRKWHRADIELRATLLAFHLVDQQEGLRRAKHLLQWSHGELDTSDLRQRALVLVEEFEVKESDEA